jgi:IS1 family transposase
VRLGLFGELGLVQEISCRGGQRPVPILAIIYCKDRNRTEEIARKNPDAGDVWLWVAVDADSKLVPSWRLGQRDLATATDFVNDLAKRVKGRVQITTDALKTYVNVIEDAFGSEADFAQLHKVYRARNLVKVYTRAQQNRHSVNHRKTHPHLQSTVPSGYGSCNDTAGT